ncbi:SIMPL domain-containing protein [bacterium]|nr:SIMPL domain-containing protein [bacterium]
MEEKRKSKIITGVFLCVGLMCAGFFPGYYYFKTYKTNNSVVVKGLAEMDVKADLAIWKIKFTVAENDMIASQKKVENQLNEVINFLKSAGFTDEEITPESLSVVDKLAERYSSNTIPTYRYILTQKLIVQSNNVNLVETSSSNISSLISKGIIFDGDEYSKPVSYLFTGLNEIKPKMLEEATKNAKQSAQEFAKASDSKVGKIRKASQGVFSILAGTDEGYEKQSINKKVRVVSTIEYWLD